MTATVEQLRLDLAPLVTPVYAPGMTLDERYAAWIVLNPHVLDLMERLAEPLIRNGHKVGAKAIAERIRWEAKTRTTGDVYRVNNSYVSRLARDLVARRPEWDAFIDRRALASERSP